MNANIFKVILFGLSSLSIVPKAYAEEWKMIDHYQIREGLAKDVTTGLIWMRCSLGQNWNGSTCLGNAAKLTWNQAMDVPKYFDYSGYSDWHLPTSDELKTLVHCSTGKTKPFKNDGRTACADDDASPDEMTAAIVKEVFPATTEPWFWTSSAYAKGLDYAWFVDFMYGYEDFISKDDAGAVRLVRKAR